MANAKMQLPANRSRAFYLPASQNEIGGGFEAPRNSLDVSNNGWPRDLHDIPVGYEVPASISKRHVREDCVRPDRLLNDVRNPTKAMASKVKKQITAGAGTLSVVARLMGLDPFPPQQQQRHGPSITSGDNLNSPHDPAVSMRSYPAPCHDKLAHHHIPTLSVGDIVSMGYGRDLGLTSPCRKSYHPQKKQLVEFKKDFASKVSNKHHSFRGKEEEEDDDDNIWHDDCFDALEFIHAGTDKALSSKVLNEDVATRKTRGGSSGINRLQRSFSESRKYSRHDSRVEAMSCANIPKRYSYGFNELLPDNTQFDETIMPTRIVVLKPDLGCNAIHMNKTSMTNSSLTPSVMGFSNTKAKTKTKEKGLHGKENCAKDLSKYPSVHLSNDTKRRDIELREKPYSDTTRQVVQQVIEETCGRVPKESTTLRTRSETRKYFEPCSRRSSTDNVTQSCNVDNLSMNARHTRPKSEVHESSAMRKSFALERRKRRMRNGSISTTMALGHGMISKERGQGKGDGCHWLDPNSSVKPESYNIRSICGNMLKVSDHHTPKLLSRSLSAPTTSLSRGSQSSSWDSEKLGTLSSIHNSENLAEPSMFKGKLSSLKDSLLSSKKEKSSKKKHRLESSFQSSNSSIAMGSTVNEYCEVEGKEREGSSFARVSTTSSSKHDEESMESSDNHLHHIVCSNNTMKPKRLIRYCGEWSLRMDDMDKAFETIIMDNTLEATDMHDGLETARMDKSPEAKGRDKCEQPSPISVLEVLPFQEESPNSDTIGIEDCKHHHHEFDGYTHGDTLSPTSSSLTASELLEAAEVLPIGSNPCIKSICGSSIITTIWGVEIPRGRHEELKYIKDVLAFVGFAEHEEVMNHTFSIGHRNKLNMKLFMRLEDTYRKSGVELVLDSNARRFLFDVVGEMVSMQLKACWTPWSNVQCLRMTGKGLLQHIWAKLSLSHYFDVSPKPGDGTDIDTCMATEELAKENRSWVQANMQCVANELEILLFSDLIHELVHECISR